MVLSKDKCGQNKTRSVPKIKLLDWDIKYKGKDLLVNYFEIYLRWFNTKTFTIDVKITHAPKLKLFEI